jgi:hypothetical protein
MTKRSLVRGGCLAVLLAMACTAAAPAAKADLSVYVTGFSNEFGTLDLTTGAFSPIATLNLPPGDVMFGMGYGPDGNLYGVDSDPNANLWQINPATGGVNLIGSIGQSATDMSSSASGTLYVLSQDINAVYYTLTPPSTTPNVVGPTGISSDGLAAVSADGTQFFTTTPSQTVFGDDLVSINPMTGAATDIGSTGFYIDNGLFVNGTLYGFGDLGSTGAIVTINTTTGAATQVATYTLPGGDQIVSSALIMASVPEPSSLGMSLIGAMMGGSYVMFRHRRRRPMVA